AMASVMSFPTRIVYGKGAIKELPNELKRAGASRPLLVTDKGILQAGLLRFVAPLLEQAGIKAPIFTDFAANPTDADAIRGIEAYRAANADSVLGVGGGASLDMATAIALLVTHPPPPSPSTGCAGSPATSARQSRTGRTWKRGSRCCSGRPSGRSPSRRAWGRATRSRTRSRRWPGRTMGWQTR